MKQQEVFKKIGVIIKELNEQYNYLLANQSELNDLELELFVANAHFLADNAAVLRKLTQQSIQSPKAAAPAPEEKYFEPVVQKIQTQTGEQPVALPGNDSGNTLPDVETNSNDNSAGYSYSRPQEPATIRHELTLADIPNWQEEEELLPDELPAMEEKEESTEIPTAYSERVAERPVLQNTFIEPMLESSKEEPITINQRISALLNNTGSRITEQASTQPVADLKQAITLNDKLLYIKDLFNGYNLAYNEAIDILNRLNSI